MTVSSWKVVFSVYGHCVESRVLFTCMSLLCILHQVLFGKWAAYMEIPLSEWICRENKSRFCVFHAKHYSHHNYK